MTKKVSYCPDCPAGYRTMPNAGLPGLPGLRCPADSQKPVFGRNLKAGHVRNPVSGRDVKTSVRCPAKISCPVFHYFRTVFSA